jgi:RNA chaperone Hfq
METNLLDRMLTTYLDDQSPVTITLQNKIRVSGRIKAFDSYIVVIEGQKREFVYRHAMSCITPSSGEQKREPAPSRSAAAPTAAPKPPKTAPHKSRPHAQTAAPPSSGDTSINSSMKEGLLRWMQEQKAAK